MLCNLCLNQEITKRCTYLVCLTAVVLILTQNTTNFNPTTAYEIKKKILLWYPQICRNCWPFKPFGTSNKIFKRFNCSFTNCYIFRNHQKLPRIRNATKYDAIIFNGRLVSRMYSNQLPKGRLNAQIYIFVQIVAPDRFPMCESYFDNFFNWTMTYRLDSDVPWTYFQIKTADNITIGPATHVRWLKSDKKFGVEPSFRNKILKKTKLAWYWSDECDTNGKKRSKKEEYLKQLNDSLWQLTRRYIDTYGDCGTFEYHKETSQDALLGRQYFFHMAMEIASDKDFVTNKILTAVNHDTVPIVYGGADYTRFLPPGSYINAKGIPPRTLAKVMINLVKNRTKYFDYFKWRNQYHFVNNYDLSGVACKLCAKLNQGKSSQSHETFRLWWDEDYETTCSIKERRVISKENSIKINYLNSKRAFKSIVLWTPPNCTDCAPFKVFKTGNSIFKEHNCKYTNCYIEAKPMNQSMFPPDAIMFNGRVIRRMNIEDLPQQRSPHQNYIFVQLESSKRYPVCQDYYDNFFNWTMTYRLDSDIPWTYYRVKTFDNKIIGPRKCIKWLNIKSMKPIDHYLENKLKKKTKLIVWFVSHCKSLRSLVVNTLNKELERLQNGPVDIYGNCGSLTCPRNDTAKCNQIIRDDYMFYLAFENSPDRDYVTEKIMSAYQNYAVPVVLGNADYKSFAPPGSYLNAQTLGLKGVARKMVEMFNNRSNYFDFFRWKNHYYFEDNYHHASIACQLCEKLNENHKVSSYVGFRRWWNERWWKYCKT